MPPFETQKINDRAAALIQSLQYAQARELCLEACKSGSADAEIWCMLSMANGHLGNYVDAEESARKAIKLAPRYVYAYLMRGIALMNLFRLDEAQRCFRKLLTIQPGHADAEKHLGRCLHNSKQLGKAIGHYERALKQKPDDAELWYYLCDALERNHEPDKCNRMLGLAMKYLPQHAGIGLVDARLKRSEDRLAEAKTRLEQLLGRSDPASELRVMIANELGHIEDRLGNYDAAFSVFTESQVENERSSARHYDRSFFPDHIRRTRSVITKDRVCSWKRTLKDKMPSPIFLVGFPRSGTTLMERMLAAHSGIVTSDEQDAINSLIKQIPSITGRPDKFPDSLDGLTDKEIQKLRKLYWKEVKSHLKGPPGRKQYLDKLPLNLIQLGFINRIFPDSPIIFVLRDPRDSCLSCFMQMFGNNEAMIHFSSMEDTAHFYSMTMDLWQHYQQVLTLKVFQYRYEDLVGDAEGVLRPLIAFLGLDWEEAVLDYHKKKNRQFSSTPSYQDITKPVYSRAMGRWRNYQQHIQPALEILEPYVVRFGYQENS